MACQRYVNRRALIPIVHASELESWMEKTKVSSTDLIWMFHQRLLSFGDFPQRRQISLAIVPTGKKGWTVVVSRGSLWPPRWKRQIEAIERELQATFALKS